MTLEQIKENARRFKVSLSKNLDELGKLYVETHKRCSSGYCKSTCGQWEYGFSSYDEYTFSFGTYCFGGDEVDGRWTTITAKSEQDLIQKVQKILLEQETYVETDEGF